MHQFCVHVVCLQRGYRQDLALIHDDGVAFCMSVAGRVSGNLRVKLLEGVIPGHRAGNHVRAGSFAVQVHHIVADRPLVPMGHQAFPYHQFRAGCQLRRGGAFRVVHALDLHHFHLGIAAFFHVHFCARIQDALAASRAGTVVLFNVPDPGVLPYIETVDTVMLGILVAAVVNAAACDNYHVRAFADEEVVIDHFLQSALGHYDGNMHAFIFGSGLDPDFQSADFLLRNNFNIGRGLSACGGTVGTDVVGAFRHSVQVCHFTQQPLLNFIQLQHSVSSFPVTLNGPSHTAAFSLIIRFG